MLTILVENDHSWTVKNTEHDQSRRANCTLPHRSPPEFSSTTVYSTALALATVMGGRKDQKIEVSSPM